MSKRQIIILAIIVSAIGTSFAFYPYLPEKMASHWNAAGEVNGYMSRVWGAFLFPIILLFCYLIFLIVPHVDPKRENIERFRKYFENFIIVFLLFLYYMYVLTLFWNLGYRFELIRFLAPAFAAMFYTMGVLIGHAELNWTIGIRTPWTLSSPQVWKKTHELGGKLFKAAAVLALLGAIFPRAAICLILIPIISVSVYLVLFSFLEYRRLDSSK
jgi:uncharacterized membrane protein